MENSKLDTPETDAFFVTALTLPKPVAQIIGHDLHDFARTLERSRDAAQLNVRKLDNLTNGLLADQERLNGKLTSALERVKELSAWKEQMLAVSAELDSQKIAKMLGATIGQSCNRVINQRVPEVLAELAEVKGHVINAEQRFQSMADGLLEVGTALWIAGMSIQMPRFLHDEVKNLRADKADLTAKLKAAEEKLVYVEGKWKQTAASRDTLQMKWNGAQDDEVQYRATIARLEGELETAKMNCMVKPSRDGRNTFGATAEGLMKEVEQLQDELASLKSRPSWRPISDPPTKADADRNGNVEWIGKDGIAGTANWNPNEWNNPPALKSKTHWRPTDLPAQSVEDEDTLNNVAELLNSIGWIARNDAQHDNLKKSLPQLKEALASVKGAGK